MEPPSFVPHPTHMPIGTEVAIPEAARAGSAYTTFEIVYYQSYLLETLLEGECERQEITSSEPDALRRS